MKTYTKKAGVLALALCIAAAFVGVALADDITVTVDPKGSVTAECSPDTWNVNGSGNPAYYGTNYSTYSDNSDLGVFTVYNNGTGLIDATIQITNDAADWTATDTWTNTQDEYMINATFNDTANLSSHSDIVGIKPGSAETFFGELSPADASNTATFNLDFCMPPSGTTTSSQSITITLTYSAS